MRKGFSMIEVSIVLVIVGLILGMAVKGRDLVQSAAERAQAQRMMKLEAATGYMMLNFAGKVHRLPTSGSELDNNSINEMLINTNMLVSKDLLVPGKTFTWSYRTVNFIPGATEWSDVCSAAGDMLCPGTGLAAYTESINAYWVCRLESSLDDMRHDQGIIRSNVTTITPGVSCQESFTKDGVDEVTMYYQIF